MTRQTLHPVLVQVTERIKARSLATRQQYLDTVAAMRQRVRSSQRMGCSNLAHAWAALPEDTRLRVVAQQPINLGIVTAYNDMLSAHQPYVNFLQWIKHDAAALGATAQVAGGVPAMCDGITQGQLGMDLSLFSRDVIAQSTAVALSHDVFDAALLLGVCDKIVPGLLIGALHFGHLPSIFVPAGPMPSGLSNREKAAVRQRYTEGLASRDNLLSAEMAAYHAPGTCTFYGTANSNQMLLEAMGLHVPDSAFWPPGSSERRQMVQRAVNAVVQEAQISLQNQAHAGGLGHWVNEACIVNAMVALLATGGSTNHLIHWVAVARAAGIQINWDDFDNLSKIIPLVAKVYPNGQADVNAFQAAGGPQWVIAHLIEAGFMHGDLPTVCGLSLEASSAPWLQDSASLDVLRPPSCPFAATGGVRLLQGNLGRAIIKVSAVAVEYHRVVAPAAVFDSQQAVLSAFNRGELNRDMVVVLREQGPCANGMPELHQLTPLLGVLQDKGYRVALVTDGRMSGASGKVPAAIHLWPEAFKGGVLAYIVSGDLITLDARLGTLQVEIDDAELQNRKLGCAGRASYAVNAPLQVRGMGRELFSTWRLSVSSAEEGAVTW
jgi:phosphogluconate dehydratase